MRAGSRSISFAASHAGRFGMGAAACHRDDGLSLPAPEGYMAVCPRGGRAEALHGAVRALSLPSQIAMLPSVLRDTGLSCTRGHLGVNTASPGVRVGVPVQTDGINKGQSMNRKGSSGLKPLALGRKWKYVLLSFLF